MSYPLPARYQRKETDAYKDPEAPGDLIEGPEALLAAHYRKAYFGEILDTDGLDGLLGAPVAEDKIG